MQSEDKFSTSCIYSKRLLDKIKSEDKNCDVDLNKIKTAIYWAKKYHHKQNRKSGEPFYTHPLEVCYKLLRHCLKTDMLVAAILHDTVEDTNLTIKDIDTHFNTRIAQMVDMLTRDRPDGTKLSVEQILINAFIKGDEQVILIKLVDRIHNIETVGVKTLVKQHRDAKNTLQLFLSMAAFIGNKVLEAEIALKCHQVMSHEMEILSVQNLYSQNKKGQRKNQHHTYRLPSPDQ